MKILVNTATTYKGGGVQVARSFIEECRSFDNYEFHVVLGNMLATLVRTEEFPQNFTFYKIGYRPATRVFSFKSRDSFFRKLENRIKPDVVFTTTGPAYWRPQVPHLVAYNLPHYIYRDSPFFSQISLISKLKWDLKGKVINYFLKRESDAFVVQTEDVNRRLRRWLQSENVFTVPNTYSQYYDKPKKAARKLPKKRPLEYRFLTLSSWYPHKNLTIIPKVLEVLPNDLKNRIRFVLTLPEDEYHKHFPLHTRYFVINIGPVKPEEGPSLYEECDALFLPTLLECFSASYSEAMKMQKPILTSDLSFAHDICGDAAHYADPMNPTEIAKEITELIEDVCLQEKLVKNGINRQANFITAAERAEKYLKICEDLVYAQ